MHQRLITVNDRMQRGYVYKPVEPEGRNFSPEFRPQLSPAEMLRLGVFGGKYMTDCRHEFPARWFKGAKLAPRRRDPSLNFFGVDASQPLSVWSTKGGSPLSGRGRAYSGIQQQVIGESAQVFHGQ